MNHESHIDSLTGWTGPRRRLRRQLMLFWVLLVLAVFGAVVLVLSATGLFSNADRRLQEGLELQLVSVSQAAQKDLDQLTAQSLRLSGIASREVDNLLMRNGMTFRELNDDPEHLLELQQALYAPVLTILQASACSGTYLVLDVTANTSIPEADISRSGLYLRCVNVTGRDLVDPDVSFFRGIPDVARQKNMELHNRWNMEFDVSALPGYWDMVDQKITRAADFYYWTDRIPLKDTWEESLLLCVPIVGENGTVYGTCGVDVSSLFFQLSMPVQETEFGPVTCVLAPLESGKLMLQKGLIGGVSGTYLDDPGGLTIHHGRAFNTYISEADSSARYVGLQQLVNISLADEEYRQWVVALLLPEEHYSSYVSSSRRTLVLTCMGILLALLAVSLLLYWKVLHPVLRETVPSQAAVCPKADMALLVSFLRSGPPAQRLDREHLPEDVRQALDRFVHRASQLAGEERRLLRLLAEGCDPDGLSARTGLSRRVIRKRLNLLYEGLEARSMDDVLFYLDFFRRCGREDQLRSL